MINGSKFDFYFKNGKNKKSQQGANVVMHGMMNGNHNMDHNDLKMSTLLDIEKVQEVSAALKENIAGAWSSWDAASKLTSLPPPTMPQPQSTPFINELQNYHKPAAPSNTIKNVPKLANTKNMKSYIKYIINWDESKPGFKATGIITDNIHSKSSINAASLPDINFPAGDQEKTTMAYYTIAGMSQMYDMSWSDVQYILSHRYSLKMHIIESVYTLIDHYGLSL